jgi:hypothetical protein
MQGELFDGALVQGCAHRDVHGKRVHAEGDPQDLQAEGEEMQGVVSNTLPAQL